MLSAVRPRSLLDRVAMGDALLGISAPVYWLGLVALFLFAHDIGRVHALRRRRELRADHAATPSGWFSSLIMPWFVLAAASRPSTRAWCAGT